MTLLSGLTNSFDKTFTAFPRSEMGLKLQQSAGTLPLFKITALIASVREGGRRHFSNAFLHIQE